MKATDEVKNTWPEGLGKIYNEDKAKADVDEPKLEAWNEYWQEPKEDEVLLFWRCWKCKMGPIAPADECPKCETHMEEFLGDLAEIIIMPGEDMDELRSDDIEEVK